MREGVMQIWRIAGRVSGWPTAREFHVLADSNGAAIDKAIHLWPHIADMVSVRCVPLGEGVQVH